MLPSHHTPPTLDSSFCGRRPLVRWLVLGVVLLSAFTLVTRRPWLPSPPPLFEHGGGLGTEQGQGYEHGEHAHTRTKGPPGLDTTMGGVTTSTTTAYATPPPTPTPTGPIDWGKRRDEVKAGFVHAMQGYKTHAFPHDELLAVSGRFSDKFNGWGVTLLDSLDTMYIMGLHDDFEDALGFVGNLTFSMPSPTSYAHFFETVIRYLGGLLSAHALSSSPILRSKADDLGRLLFPVFNTSLGLPLFAVNTDTGATRWGDLGITTLFAEATSCQLEYKYLAKLTGRAGFYEKVQLPFSFPYRQFWMHVCRSRG